MSGPAADADRLRPLGAFERVIDLYMRRNPVQFSLVAELDAPVSETELEQALRRWATIHPLLAVRVGPGPAFERVRRPVPLRTAHASSWDDEAAREQSDPIDTTTGPLVRAVLVTADGVHDIGDDGDAVLLTFAHQAADGRGALQALLDLLTVLDGRPVAPRQVPAAQEDLVRTRTDAPPAAGPPPATPPPAATARLRPFDRSLPTVQHADLGADLTGRLVERARTESATVQGALCAAAATVLGSALDLARARVNVPIDLRPATASADDLVVRFAGSLVEIDTGTDVPFWDRARDATAQLATARDPERLTAAARLLAAHPPATPADAETAMLAATGADVEITNLGSVDPAGGPPRTRALRGPVMTTQVEGEQVLGAVTHDGVLRLVNTTHHPVDGLLDRISRELRAACAPARRTDTPREDTT